ncbi:MAG: DUF1330 domain-containing protein [Pseudomonadota bacterium]
MPKAYVIGHITVTDPEAYKEYIEKDTPILEAAGGKFIVRGGASEVMEGEFKQRHVVIEYPSLEAAKASWQSDEYQEVAKIRHRNALSDIVIVEGTE